MKRIIFSGYFFAIFSAICFSFKSILVKIAYTYGITPLSLCSIRVLISMPFFLVTLYLMEGKKGFSITKEDSIRFFLMGTMLAGAMFFSLQSIELIDASVATILAYIYPSITTVLLFIIQKEKIKTKNILSLLSTFVGLLFVINIGGQDVTAINGEGVLWGVGTAFCYALYSVMTQNAMKECSPIKVTTYSMLFMSIIFFIASENILTPISFDLFIIIFIMATLVGFLPFLLYSYGIKKLGAGKNAIISSSGPVFTVYWAQIFLGEHLKLIQVFGMVLVLAGILLLKSDEVLTGVNRRLKKVFQFS